jgi:hypothetical protein
LVSKGSERQHFKIPGETHNQRDHKRIRDVKRLFRKEEIESGFSGVRRKPNDGIFFSISV